MRYPKDKTYRTGLSRFSRQETHVARSPDVIAAKMGLAPLPSRRGVLLLVVLALLAMFGMVAVTFVVVASQARIAAEAHQRVDEVTEPPEKLLNSGLLQVLRGSNNLASAIGPHSLLEDVYGNNTTAEIAASAAMWDASGSLIELAVPLSILAAKQRVGGVLTVVPSTHPAAQRMVGLSTRIIAAVEDAGAVRLRLLPFEGVTAAEAVAYLGGGCNVRLSGTPFSGTGFGWQNGVAVTDPANAGLLPAHPANRNSGVLANEDYDAPDFQNMLLGAKFVDANGNLLHDTFGGTRYYTGIIPSLHRPELVNYWYNRMVQQLQDDHSLTPEDAWRAVLQPLGPGGGTLPPDVRWQIVHATRMFSLRPLREFHPNFNGSNPYSHPDLTGMDETQLSTQHWQRVGPWDVDNDGDGIPDSIWVDLGAPVRSSPDGRLYKPLFAILCLDMDGRLNLNAHGSLAQVNQDPWAATNDYYYTAGEMPAPTTWQEFASQTPVLRGQGYGPAEVNLGALFNWPLQAGAYQQQLIRARYGTNQLPGRTGPDRLGIARWFQYDYEGGFASGSHRYGTPPDMQGTIAIGLDHAGRPIWDPDFCGQPGAENPYEFNATSRMFRGEMFGGAVNVPNATDAGFSTAELERVFRYYDRDAVNLPPRLLQLTSGTIAARRHEITTDSIDVPVPGGGFDPATNRVTSGFLDLLKKRLDSAPAQYSGLNNGAGNVNVEVAEFLFGRDLVAGRKMNLDRPLDEGDLASRQEFARHLFCLAMLLREPGYQFPWPATDSGVPGNEEFLTVRRIAQWAVNVVDFLDADSVMTPFEFDPYPFVDNDGDGQPWDALTGLPVKDSAATKETNLDRLVWGMERPDVLLTETLALHDRRVEDTAFDNGPQERRVDSDDKEADPDLDQPRMPQGSLFIELYCTSEPGSNKPTSLYTEVGGEWLLDLGKRVVNSPVWRLAITENARIGTNNPNNLEERLSNAPVTFSLETNQVVPATPPDSLAIPRSSLVPGSTLADNVVIERIVSFATIATPAPAPVYYNHGSADVRLAPGQYLVVGPRARTVVGSRVESGSRTAPPEDSPQVISLNPISITDDAVSDALQYPTPGTHIQQPKAMIAGARWPAVWGQFIGISVSEPLPANYYPIAEHTYAGIKEWYGDPNMSDVTKPYLDKPLDSRSGMPLADTWDGNKGTVTRTTPGFKYVLLQRLADPSQRFHAITNPYLTVDWMPIDLTVFNGMDQQPTPWPPLDDSTPPQPVFPWKPWDPDDPSPNATSPPNSIDQFATRQRAGSAHSEANLWVAGPDAFSLTPAASYVAPTGKVPYFKHPLGHSLGFLNEAFGRARDSGNPYPGLDSPPAHLGDPMSPFPWLTWNNRPLVNPYELMMVPATTAARFGWEFTMAPTGGPKKPYSAGADSDKMHVYDHDEVGFVHLMNLFHSGTGTSELHRILEFVTVPSRFAGAQLYAPTATAPDHLQPTYREPGKINLNTVFSEQVFRGLMNGFGDTTLWRHFVRSRRGYRRVHEAEGLAMNPLEMQLEIHPDYPTRFARPFRAPGASKLYPDGIPAVRPQREVDATLLRSEPLAMPGPADPPLSPTDPDLSDRRPLFAFDSTDPIHDTERNPYFRHQGLMRLGNLTTTRSNVYAVWITVGFFEVEPVAYDPSNPASPSYGMDADEFAAVYPGGYQLGRELGTDTGQIRRHRAFYMIDRSIPVGFVRGEDLNVEKTVLLQRFIE